MDALADLAKELVGALPDWAQAVAVLLILTLIMAIASAAAIRRMGAANHFLYRLLLFIIGLIPLGPIVLILIYAISKLQSEP